jgi:hypothetical protein
MNENMFTFELQAAALPKSSSNIPGLPPRSMSIQPTEAEVSHAVEALGDVTSGVK